MTAQSTLDASKAGSASAAASSSRLDGAVAAFGLSAALAIVFNTALAWIKDSVPAVNEAMKSMTGHHWRTHGLLDIAVFLIFGMIFMQRRVTFSGGGLGFLLTLSVLVGGGGLAAWFALF